MTRNDPKSMSWQRYGKWREEREDARIAQRDMDEDMIDNNEEGEESEQDDEE